jgi:hypothetical protein
MKITFKQNAEDYLEFYTFLAWKHPDLKPTRVKEALTFIFVMIFFMLFIIPEGGFPSFETREIIIAAILVLILILTYLLGFGKARRNKIKNILRKSLQVGYEDISYGELEINLNDQDISVKGEGFEKRYEWEVFSFYHQDGDLVYLYNPRADFLVIPTFAIEDFTGFEQFVNKKIKENSCS